MQKTLANWLRFSLGFVMLLSYAQATQASPSVPDTLEQRLAACSQCHGEKGQGNPDMPGVPHIAGKPAGYLYQQLQSFQTGRRDNDAMQYVVSNLTPAYLKTIAKHYASQPIVYVPKVPDGISDEVLAYGEDVVKNGDSIHRVPSCASCHGAKLTGVKPMIPGVLGLSYTYIKNQLHSWRANERSAAGMHCMWVVANRMTDKQVKAVAAWLSSQPLPDDPSLITEDQLSSPLPGWCGVEASEVTP